MKIIHNSFVTPLQNNYTYGFVTGWENSQRNFMIWAKYLLMNFQKVVYPDVYCIPFWLGGKCKFISNGARVEPRKYDFILAELNAGDDQLRYIGQLLEADPHKVVIITSVKEIFNAYASKTAQGLAAWILRRAGHVWAYSVAGAQFANHCAQAEVARVIPWPFNYAETRRLGRIQNKADNGRIRVLVGVPLRFAGIAANNPHFLEDCFFQALETLPASGKKRFQFYGMVYTPEDKAAWRETGFGRRIGVVLEPKKSYVRFLRFVSSCDAVLTLPRFGVLGRITFIAAALGKPGIFTSHVELSRRLYPHSLVDHATDEALYRRVRDLLYGLLDSGPMDSFRPDTAAAQEVGDFAGNAAEVRKLLEAKF